VSEVIKLGKYLPESLHDSDLVAMLTFTAISAMLLLVGMGRWLGDKAADDKTGA
jgi:hypothetical protein